MPDQRSLLERASSIPLHRREILAAATVDARMADLSEAWAGQARQPQLPPGIDWDTWLILAGRGFGKTRAGVGWVSQVAGNVPGARIALLGATAADARTVTVEGELGLLAKGRRVPGSRSSRRCTS